MNPEAVPGPGAGGPGGSPSARTFISSARALSNSTLIARVRALAGDEQQVTALLIAHLAVLDERQLYLVEGCASMFTYLTQVLHFSEYAAYGRIQAARAARRYPLILDLLCDGSVNLTTITLVAPELTPRTHRDVLEAARHKSRRQVEELIARLRPRPPAPPLIRRLPAPASLPDGTLPRPGEPQPPAGTSLPPGFAPADEPSSAAAASSAAGSAAGSATPGRGASGSEATRSEATESEALLFGDLPAGAASQPPAQPRNIITPLAARYYRVQFTASEETHAKLRAAQDLLRHQIPDGDLGRILDRALSSLLVELTRRKVGGSGPRQPAAGPPSPAREPRPSAGEEPRDGAISPQISTSRHIPAEVRRTVWVRDGGRCAFVAPGGRRCTERGFLEFHHVVPRSAGGPPTADNIELRCRAHNGYEAMQALEGPPLPRTADDPPGIHAGVVDGGPHVDEPPDENIHGTPPPRPPT